MRKMVAFDLRARFLIFEQGFDLRARFWSQARLILLRNLPLHSAYWLHLLICTNPCNAGPASPLATLGTSEVQVSLYLSTSVGVLASAAHMHQPLHPSSVGTYVLMYYWFYSCYFSGVERKKYFCTSVSISAPASQICTNPCILALPLYHCILAIQYFCTTPCIL